MESAENREQSPQTNQPQGANDSSSLSKSETIKLLNDSIDKLESTIKEIGKNSAQNLPSSDSINTLLSTTQELADSVASPPPQATPSPAPVAEIPPESTTPIPTPPTTEVESTPTVKPEPEKSPVQPSNQETKQDVTKNKQKKNRGLIIIGIVGVAIAIIAIVWLLLPEPTSTVSSSTEPTTTEIIDTDSEIRVKPETIEITDTQTNLEDSTEDISLDRESTESELEIPQEIPIPSELVSPGRATNLKIETIEPELTFTPEQTLIAALQTKLAELAADYDPDLFDSVKVNLPDNSLILKVTDKWYSLNESRQDKLANEILKRSRQFDFSKLEFQDPAGKLVARNPVVGDRAILIQTSKDN